MLAGHASGCWLSALGAGVPYNREEEKKVKLFFLAVAHFRYYFPANIDSSLTKVPSLQTTGSPQGIGFPSTSGHNSGTFGKQSDLAKSNLYNSIIASSNVQL